MADRPTVLGVATYPDKDSAVADFRAVWGIHHEGKLDHVAAAVLAKGIDGKLRIGPPRHDGDAPRVGRTRSSVAPSRSSPRHWRSCP